MREKKNSNRDSDVAKKGTFAVEDEFLIAYAAALTAIKWKSFSPKMYGPCNISRVNHQKYDLVSKLGRHNRSSIYAQSFAQYLPFFYYHCRSSQKFNAFVNAPITHDARKT